MLEYVRRNDRRFGNASSDGRAVLYNGVVVVNTLWSFNKATGGCDAESVGNRVSLWLHDVWTHHDRSRGQPPH